MIAKLKKPKVLTTLILTLFIVGGGVFWFTYQAQGVTRTWDGGGVDGTCGGAGTANNWTCAANWSADTVPTSADTAVFDGTSTKNATINANLSGGTAPAGISINAGYTGTITQATGVTIAVGASGFSQAAGTFTGGNSAVTIGNFTLSGGVFTSTSGTLTIGSGATFTQSAGTFNHNNGTIQFGNNTAGHTTANVPTSITFYDLVAYGNHNYQFIITSGDTLIATNSFTHTDGMIMTGTIEVRNTATIGAGADGGNGTISFLDTNSQSISGSSGGASASLNINKASGTVTASGSFTVAGFTLTSGTFTSTSGTLTIGSGATFTQSGGTFNHNNGTIQFGSNAGAHTSADVSTSLTFYDLVVYGANAYQFIIASGDTLIATNSFTHTDGMIITGTIEVRNTASIGAGADGGTGTIAFLDTNNQTISGTGYAPNLNINKASGSVTANDSFQISGLTLASGTFNAPAGTLTVANGSTATFTQSGGTFNHNNGTVIFGTGGGNYATIDVVTSLTLYNVTVNFSPSYQLTITSGDTVVVLNTFTHTSGRFDTGTFEIRNAAVIGANANSGTGYLAFLDTGNQTISGSGGYTGGLNINKSAGTVTASGTLGISGFTLASGTFVSTPGTLTMAQNFSFTQTGGTFNHNNGTVIFGTGGPYGITLDVPTSLTLYNMGVNLGGGYQLLISSGDTVVVLNTFTHTDGPILTGTIEIRQSAVITATADTGSGTLAFLDTANQTIVGSAGGYTALLSINKSSGSVTASGDLGVSGVTLSSGTFNAPTGTLSIAGTTSLTQTGGTWNHNNGTISFGNGGNGNNLYVPTSITFYHVTVNEGNNWPFTIDTGDTMIVLGTFTHTDGRIETGTIEARGDVVIGAGADGNTSTLSFTGTGDQTYTDNGGNEVDGDITINKPVGAVVNLASNADWNAAGQDLTITSGVLNLGAYTLRTGGTLTIGANGGLYCFSTGDLILGGPVANAGTVRFASAGSCGSTDSISITSSSGGVQRAWSGAGSFTMWDVSVQDQGGSAAITAYSSTSVSGNGGNWTFSGAACPQQPEAAGFSSGVYNFQSGVVNFQ